MQNRTCKLQRPHIECIRSNRFPVPAGNTEEWFNPGRHRPAQCFAAPFRQDSCLHEACELCILLPVNQYRIRLKSNQRPALRRKFPKQLCRMPAHRHTWRHYHYAVCRFADYEAAAADPAMSGDNALAAIVMLNQALAQPSGEPGECVMIRDHSGIICAALQRPGCAHRMQQKHLRLAGAFGQQQGQPGKIVVEAFIVTPPRLLIEQGRRVIPLAQPS
ncbi:hypothetical protein D3C73_979650 [compost metagenome]